MAVTVQFFDNFIKDIGLGRMNLSTDSFKVFLVNGYTFNRTNDQKNQITQEVADINGYVLGGKPLVNVNWDWDNSNLFTKFDADDVTFIATGGSIGPMTGAIIYNDSIVSPTPDRLMCYIDFGGSETITPSSELRLIFGANGIFSISE